MKKFISNRRLPRSQIHGALVVAVLTGLAGSYLLNGAWAATSNPAYAGTCGYDVTIAIDTSTSVSVETHKLYKKVATTFVNTMRDTNSRFMVMIENDDNEVYLLPTGDIDKVTRAIKNIIDPAYRSDLNPDRQLLKNGNPRPDKQDILFLLGDGGPDVDPEIADEIKAQGIRMLYFLAGDKPIEKFIGEHKLSFGPRVDTGNINTTDIMTTASDYTALFSQLKAGYCTPPGPSPEGPGDSSGPGDRGDGGNGNKGEGTGTNGKGKGTGQQSTGSGGGGGGGSTANQQDDKPNPLPSTSQQGNKDKQSEVEPSVFFDGKLFAVGSDPDTIDVKGVSIAGRTYGFGWLYLLIALLIAGIGGYSGWRWWKRKRYDAQE